jgi:hypothetical protein
MLIDGGASVNILPLSLFKKLGHVEGDLKRTNLSLSGLQVPTTFFVLDVKGSYNVLLKWDWIHANKCVPSTLHQCVI